MDLQEELEKLNVHGLRDVARKINISSPTTKSSDSLKKEIVDVSYGKKQPKKSKMGRPPKNSTVALENVYKILAECSVLPLNYENVNLNFDELAFCADNYAQENKFEPKECWGIVRKHISQFFIKNYENGIDYVIFNKNSNDVTNGDLVVGKYNSFKNGRGIINEYNKFELADNNCVSEYKAVVKQFESTEEMYEFVEKQNGNKIVVEVEAINTDSKLTKNEIYLCTKECSDVVVSYNMFLDAKAIIENLCEKEKQFTIYFINLDYAFSILKMYYQFKKMDQEINAGQYFKEILSIISKSKNGSIVLCQNKKGIKSSYLDLILNKYCKKA